MRLLSLLILAAPLAALAQPHAAPGHAGGVLQLPMSRWASGTSWQPDAAPMFAYQLHSGPTMLMVHANVFAGWDAMGSDRGAGAPFAVNWLMPMLRVDLPRTTLAARVMISLEPWTVRDGGYPLLLQTGEAFEGVALHDRQHPHDLLMELAGQVLRQVGPGVGLLGYAALAGEPALGPTAYPHRVSSLWLPFAPIGHHWLDSTHIAFGVLTAGMFTRHVKLEASWFNGREPDEDRTDVDLRAPDSWSGRLAWNPSASWSTQLSFGWLASPEAHHPALSIRRLTASATWSEGPAEHLDAATFAVGRNELLEEGLATHAALVEGALVRGVHVLTGRAEVVQKTGDDLVLGTGARERHVVAQLSLGYEVRLPSLDGMRPGVGLVGLAALLPAGLEAFYGTRLPLGGAVFVHLLPTASMPGMGGP